MADEPLAGLDPGHQFDACDLLRDVAATGAGVVITLHDLSLAARLADRIVLLHDTRLVADGPPVVALTPERLRDVYDMEASVTDDGGSPQIHLLRRRRDPSA